MRPGCLRRIWDGSSGPRITGGPRGERDSEGRLCLARRGTVSGIVGVLSDRPSPRIGGVVSQFPASSDESRDVHFMVCRVSFCAAGQSGGWSRRSAGRSSGASRSCRGGASASALPFGRTPGDPIKNRRRTASESGPSGTCTEDAVAQFLGPASTCTRYRDCRVGHVSDERVQ